MGKALVHTELKRIVVRRGAGGDETNADEVIEATIRIAVLGVGWVAEALLVTIGCSAGGVCQAGIVTSLRLRISLDIVLVMTSNASNIASPCNELSWELTLKSELEVLRVRRTEPCSVLAQAEGGVYREVRRRTSARRNEGELVRVDPTRASHVEVLEGGGKTWV